MDRRLAGFVDGEGLREQWAREACDEGPRVWTCPMCGEIYSEADERLGKNGRAECPYCEEAADEK